MCGTSAKLSSLCISTGQTAASNGEVVGGSPGNTTVTPCMGAQRPGAANCLPSGAALCGVGKEQHHHPPGGAGHY